MILLSEAHGDEDADRLTGPPIKKGWGQRWSNCLLAGHEMKHAGGSQSAC